MFIFEISKVRFLKELDNLKNSFSRKTKQWRKLTNVFVIRQDMVTHLFILMCLKIEECF